MKKIFFAAFLLANACSDLPLPPNTTAPSSDLLLVSASDFSTGFLSAVSLKDFSSYKDILLIHSDAVPRVVNNEAYVLNRFGADSLLRTNRYNSYSAVYETSLGRRSNPHDAVMIDSSRLLLSLYEKNFLAVVSMSDGQTLSTISTAAYADADDIPECSALYAGTTHIYAACQRLNRTLAGWPPAANGILLKINKSTLVIENTFTMPYANPVSKLRFASIGPSNVLVFAAPGRFAFDYQLDGAALSFDLAGETFSTLLTESAAGSEISDAVQVSATVAFAITLAADKTSRLIVFNPATGTVTKVLASNSGSSGGYYSDLAVDGDNLFLADRNPFKPGVRVFSISGQKEITSEPISTGLPPFGFAVLK